ncbi:L-lactate dehydrogenase-like [Apis florea]|uniref:L-lactate dehydrogenase-like n=1 Tax=Apis florea TaxID=7463 RepID=UPI0012FF552A|nr:L-lactate dehydrogenase-like [Apis florea]
MVLSRMLSSLSLPTYLKCSIHLISRRNLTNKHFNRTLPPTILKDIFGGNVKKKVASADFGKDANAGSDFQRAVSFVQPCLKEELLCKFSEPVQDCCHKVTVVGSGMVGVAIVNSLIFQVGRVLIHKECPLMFTFNAENVISDFCITSNSKVIILAAGARQMKGESRLDLVQRNSEILKSIIPTLVGYSPNAVILVVSNPVDILSWLTWKISGLPASRIIGTGTHVDSARFRFLIADRLGIAASSVHATIIGEHGDSQVPLWSGVNVAGVQFRDILPNIGLETDEERWYELSKEVVRLGPTVRCLKGYTNTTIGLATADIVRAILNNSQRVIPVSTLIQTSANVVFNVQKGIKPV